MEDGRLVWEADPVPGLTADAVLAGAGPSSTDRGDRTAAEQVLREVLEAGPIPMREVLGAARAEMVSERTLKRAKAALGVVARKLGQGPWFWCWPGAPWPPKGAKPANPPIQGDLADLASFDPDDPRNDREER